MRDFAAGLSVLMVFIIEVFPQFQKRYNMNSLDCHSLTFFFISSVVCLGCGTYLALFSQDFFCQENIILQLEQKYALCNVNHIFQDRVSVVSFLPCHAMYVSCDMGETRRACFPTLSWCLCQTLTFQSLLGHSQHSEILLKLC